MERIKKYHLSLMKRGRFRGLPIITYKNNNYYVDFRLGELRDTKTVRRIRFTSIPEGKNSYIKQKLRLLRSYTFGNEYIHGLDD